MSSTPIHQAKTKNLKYENDIAFVTHTHTHTMARSSSLMKLKVKWQTKKKIEKSFLHLNTHTHTQQEINFAKKNVVRTKWFFG